jgi:hypothetical protein
LTTHTRIRQTHPAPLGRNPRIYRENYTYSPVNRFYLGATIALMTYCALAPIYLYAQHPTERVDCDQLILSLDQSLSKGSKRALRDVCTLLSSDYTAECEAAARMLLRRYTFFTVAELEVDYAHRTAALDFYYDNTNKILFSEALQGFYLTPLEQQSHLPTFNLTFKPLYTPDETSLRDLNQHWEKALLMPNSAEKGRAMQRVVREIAALQTKESWNWLLNMLNNNVLGNQPNDTYQIIAECLQDYTRDETLTTLLSACHRGILTPETLTNVFLELTNIALEPATSKQLLDSLQTLEGMREAGYEAGLPFREAFFYEKVDYYGKILCRSETAPWLRHNALRDLQATEHPRMLFYIAAQLRLQPNHKFLYFNILKKLIQKDMLFDAANPVEIKQFVQYWAIHSEEYEWDKARHCFVNRAELAARTQTYEYLFRRLNSKNDTAAQNAFLALTDGEPLLITEMSEQYRSLLRSYNKNLPDMKHGYLEQMTKLRTYCKRNKIDLQLPNKCDSLVELLSYPCRQKERFKMENQLLKYLELNDITALEWYAFLHSSNTELSFSLGRVLDYFYSRVWKEITTDAEQLRLLLKKTVLFKQIGAVGACSVYENKFIYEDTQLLNMLQNVLKTEEDDDIASQIRLLNLPSMPVVTTEKETKLFGNDKIGLLSAFLNDPTPFANTDLKVLPQPNDSIFGRVTSLIQETKDPTTRRILFDYLSRHPYSEMVPHLFRIIGDMRKVALPATENMLNEDNSSNSPTFTRVDVRVVELLEAIYNHNFDIEDADAKREAWRDMWKKDGTNYQLWNILFFKQQMSYLKMNDSIDIFAINRVAASIHFTPKHRNTVLELLSKVKPVGDIRHLQLNEKISAGKELIYLSKLRFTHKELPNIVKLIHATTDKEDQKLWQFIEVQIKDYSQDQLTDFYNNLFKIKWFNQLLYAHHGGQKGERSLDTVQRNRMIETLKAYLESGELVSEFQEQACLLHIMELENVGKTLAEKLEATTQLENVSQESRAAIQEAILARIDYADIPVTVRFFEQLPPEKVAFLYKDFGLPIFDLDEKDRYDLIFNITNLAESKVYEYYLKKFGVDFQNSKGELDFDKIHEILRFEIVLPFTGGGNQRDLFTYGVIKLLEFKFKTRLGFHEKLNENQTFYTFTAAKRAAAWLKFLETKGLVKPDPSIPSSFNRLLAGG